MHIAAKEGYLNICQLILENTHKKNPNCLGYTPLDLAANNGHFEICKLIVKEIANKKLTLMAYNFRPP